jgi:hypothetical protein
MVNISERKFLSYMNQKVPRCGKTEQAGFPGSIMALIAGNAVAYCLLLTCGLFAVQALNLAAGQREGSPCNVTLFSLVDSSCGCGAWSSTENQSFAT